MNREYTIVSPYWIVAEPAMPHDPDFETTSLSRHADDVYKLLLRKLAAFEILAEPAQSDIEALRNVLEEFILVTRMVKGGDAN